MASQVNEEVQLKTTEVKLKKREGTLYLLKSRLVWSSNGRSEAKDFDVNYADIETQKVSGADKPKVQLQIITNNQTSHVFHFFNPETARTDQVKVKVLLMKMMTVNKRTLDNGMEEKRRVLQENPHTFHVYKDLVVTNAITPEEFWNSNSKKLLSNKKNPEESQNVGISGGFLSDLQPPSDGCNEFQYNLSSDTSRSILCAFPGVLKKYNANVPHLMDPTAFWIAFFQSHYYHRDRVSQGGDDNNDLFADCVKLDEKEMKALLNEGVSNKFNDVNYLQEDDSAKAEGYGNTQCLDVEKPTTKQQKAINLIRRTNYQNAMVLKEASKHSKATKAKKRKILQSGDNDNDDVEAVAGKKKVLKEETVFSDLISSEEKQKKDNFSLVRFERYSHGPTTEQSSSTTYNQEEALWAVEQVKQQVYSYQPNIAGALSSESAATALKILTVNEFSNPHSTSGSFKDPLKSILSPELAEELLKLNLSSNELLKHFWACTSPSTVALEEKFKSLNDHIVKFYKEKVQPFKAKLREEYVGVNVS